MLLPSHLRKQSPIWKAIYSEMRETLHKSQLSHSDDGREAFRVRHVIACKSLPFPFLRRQDCERAVVELNKKFPVGPSEVVDNWPAIRVALADCCAW